ncbi:hypothetical protein QTG56_22540 (plasmid) [Rossellomorea sp. AcN35-11]|nr:hypothetical protein QTG56_22540 [Rossellomorea sp. AcN35-11]
MNRIPKTHKNKAMDKVIDALEHKSLDQVAKKFGMTQGSIRSKLARQGMGIRGATGYISASQLANILGVDIWVPIRWINNKGMPAKRRSLVKDSNQPKSYLIDINEFWIWAKKNTSFIDLTKMSASEYIPDWAYELKKEQMRRKLPREGVKWTKGEIDTLVFYLGNPDMDLTAISDKLGRSKKAIERKIQKTPKIKVVREEAKKRGNYIICIEEIQIEIRGVVTSKGMRYLKVKDHPYANKKGLISEARLVMEKKLQRFLRPEEVVFRYNEDKSDNRPENLYIKITNRREYQIAN